MAITITTPPNKVKNFAATLQSGGSLDASTTYEFRIVGKNVSSYPLSNQNCLMTPASGIISITTDATNKTIKLTWTHISGYDYYIIGYRKSGDTHWNTIKDGEWPNSDHYSRYATDQASSYLIFDDPVGQANSSELAPFQTYVDPANNINTYFPIDKDLGIGRVEISGSSVDVYPEDIKKACKEKIGNLDFTGSGLDDMSIGGTYTEETDAEYLVEIDGTGTPDTFKWSKDGGTTWEATGVSITGSAQTLDNGVTVTFGATTGHTIGDQWTFRGGYNSYFVYNGATIFTRFHIALMGGTTGTLNLQNKNIYPMQVGMWNFEPNATFDLNHSGIYLVGYGWRFNTKYMNLTHAQVMNGAFGGIPGQSMLWSGNTYEYIYNSTVIDNAKIENSEMQIYEGSTLNNVRGGSFRINRINYGGAGKTTILNCVGTKFLFLYNTDWTGWGKDIYEIRNFHGIGGSYDMHVYYNSKEHRVYDFKGEKGMSVNGSYDKPYVRWRSPTTDNTVVKLYHLLDFHIINESGTDIENATITVYDKDDNQLWTDTTDSDGKASEDILTTTVSYGGGGSYSSTYTSKNPLRIVVQKSGYKKIEFKETVEEKREDWAITLKRASIQIDQEQAI